MDAGLRGGRETERRLADEPGFLTEVESVGHSIRNPAAKLRYLRGTLVRYRDLDQQLRRMPTELGRRKLYSLMGLEGLHESVTVGVMSPVGSLLPPQINKKSPRGRLLAAVSVLLAVTAAATTALQASRPTGAPGGPAGAALPAASGSPAAEKLVALPAGVAPKAIWLVEKGAGFELWSNGLRIDTSSGVEAPPRRYRTFLRGRGAESEVRSRPAGILFHTTESDVWPLEAQYNENLRDSTQKLLRYLGRERVYHYLVDRFGRVWRVVGEGSKANHAGNSVWASGDRIFLGLNASFLGVSFESRWDGGRALPITEAQLLSGRSLTDYLRRRYEIPPEMCVSHGLVSVNPAQRLIGHHLDWARGFPFGVFALPDQYARPSPAVEEFGFGYDERLLRTLGEPWAGVSAAEAALAEEARAAGRSLQALRRERQELFDRWQAEQLRDEPVAGSGQALPQPGKGSGG